MVCQILNYISFNLVLNCVIPQSIMIILVVLSRNRMNWTILHVMFDNLYFILQFRGLVWFYMKSNNCFSWEIITIYNDGSYNTLIWLRWLRYIKYMYYIDSGFCKWKGSQLININKLLRKTKQNQLKYNWKCWIHSYLLQK